jgi:hypothetical protein
MMPGLGLQFPYLNQPRERGFSDNGCVTIAAILSLLAPVRLATISPGVTNPKVHSGEHRTKHLQQRFQDRRVPPEAGAYEHAQA